MLGKMVKKGMLVFSFGYLVACSGSNESPDDAEGLGTFKSQNEFLDYLSTIDESGNGQFADGDVANLAEEESITNNQESGVDEGGIVKVYGDYFVLLRKGKLFTIAKDDGLAPVDELPSHAPESELGTWYDELIIHENTVVVLGYSYRVGATEVGIFSIDSSGVIEHKETYFLRSFDYYSSRNYASRLVNNELIFYMPYFLSYDNYQNILPAMLRLEDIEDRDASYEQIQSDDDWVSLIEADAIVKPLKENIVYPSLHAVIRCNLVGEFSCEANGIIAPFARTFYVSRDAIYLWTNNAFQYGEDEDNSLVYRIPLDSDNIQVLASFGAPIDQFSFKDDGTYLQVLLQQYSGGDWMWFPEYSAGDLVYAKIPISTFGSTLSVLEDAHYYPLIDPGYGIRNRFVGDYLLFGSYSNGKLYGVNTDNPRNLETLTIDSNVLRVDRLGEGAVIVGQQKSTEFSDANLEYNANLSITAVGLDGSLTLQDNSVIENAYQGENRSHGYNTTSVDDGSLFGLPIIQYREVEPNSQSGNSFIGGWYPASTDIVYYHADTNLGLTSLGQLNSLDDQWISTCEVSCVDWYGNARPIFYEDRIYGLMGYELVEGQLDQNVISEIRRVNFTPEQ